MYIVTWQDKLSLKTTKMSVALTAAKQREQDAAQAVTQVPLAFEFMFHAECPLRRGVLPARICGTGVHPPARAREDA